jgi:hypothetical protein
MTVVGSNHHLSKTSFIQRRPTHPRPKRYKYRKEEGRRTPTHRNPHYKYNKGHSHPPQPRATEENVQIQRLSTMTSNAHAPSWAIPQFLSPILPSLAVSLPHPATSRRL